MSQTEAFLLEIGSEEMPSAPLNRAIKEFKKLLTKAFEREGLPFGEITIYSSPRRLTAYVSDVATQTREVHEVNRGPKVEIAFDKDGNPTKAALGFAKKFGVDPKDLAQKEEADGHTYIFAETHIPSRPTMPILSAISEQVIAQIPWPRSQRWGSEHAKYVRPIRWIVALLGDTPVEVHYADVLSGNETSGHRVMAPGMHKIEHARDYLDVLRSSYVMVQEEREAHIRAGIADIEKNLVGAHVDTPAKTFDEVVNLCEWPTVLVGQFDEEFLSVPHEIICESMLSNQRYFPIYNAEGELTRQFVIVSNSDPKNNGRVIDGNERVVRARLDDAKFFFEEDLKQPLEAYVENLKQVVFQEKLGTVYSKAERMVELAGAAATDAGLAEDGVADARRAALLAKADLTSQAVVEFTSQQGTMGGYYALASGEKQSVADAICEHYRPRFSGDEIPSERLGRFVALADKLDTVCGIFAINEPPTGSSDPFAVRRAALGIIAILQAETSVSLDALIDLSLDLYAGQGLVFDHAEVKAQIRNFFQGRLASIAKDEGIEPDTIEAIAAQGTIEPCDYLARAHALHIARNESPELFADLASAYARAATLADESLGYELDSTLFEHEAEHALLSAIQKASHELKPALEKSEYAQVFEVLATLRAPIDTYFTDVLVNDERDEVRVNHIRTLNRFTDLFGDVADMGKLVRKK